ncbi:hypothetical protein M5C97_18010 [Acidovorax sp. NCPPB 3859]|nr:MULTISPECIES: hypothetical protein [unclassified Acidovorax]MDA8450493.1 hypothetical protein [Acidovorax sp. GBBC 3297]MDA8459833.1 hypothetical protein [Acidovorax sp. GBBC 3333]MDA8464869.1 hypothetical protein [Acidovorax sp. GBBC 3332]MDA8470008.1 hypothetical protein [Acidovorax sp. GBBC 3299]WCM77399.1 hypothetical protein M5C94_17960 [Acidovorax sp. GBBC 712]
MKRLAHGLLAASLPLVLAGCYTPDRARLGERVAAVVPAGTRLETAMASLSGMGFSCQVVDAGQGVDCSRERHGAVLYTCIERVRLSLDTGSRSVAAPEVPPIACAGL